MHALICLWLAACQSSDSSSAAPSKAVASTSSASTASTSTASSAPSTGAAEPVLPTAPEGGFSEPPGPSGDGELGPAPAWFRPDAFEHTAIIRQDLAGARVPSGQTSAMIVLELPAATTPEQCIEQFRSKLAETVKDPPIATTMPQGHLSLRGKGDNYEYTVVCGMAKDKPTMFLSYSQ
jgi:hypothetical protein